MDDVPQERSMMPRLILFAVVVVIVLAGLYIGYRSFSHREAPIGGQKDANGCVIAAGYRWCTARSDCERPWERYCTTAAPKTAVFTCDNGKNIIATFYPTDDKYVDLLLSDTRAMSVPHAISASGARYATESDAFVFWNKGNTAFITENGTITYSGCVTQVQ